MITFIDVSGDPYSLPSKSPWIVAHAVCIRKRALHYINNTVFRLKRDILNNENIEIKATDLINNSTLSNQGLNKFQFVQKFVFECIDHCDCFHAAIVFENSGNNRRSEENYLPKHYRDLLFRVEAIVRKARALDTIVIIDNNRRKVDKNLSFAFNNYLYRSRGGDELTHVLPVPIFADSEMTIGLQISDIAAGILRQFYSNNLHNIPKSAEESLYYKTLREFQRPIVSRCNNYIIKPYGNISGLLVPGETYSA